MGIPVFVTARTTSSRLPKKCLLPLGDGNVIEHIIRRAKFFDLDPIVCTTNNSSDDVLAQIANQEGVRYFRGADNDKLKRWRDCCVAFDIPAFHSIDGDDPFFDPILVKESFALLAKGYDVISPTYASMVGSGSVGYSLTQDIVNAAWDLTTTLNTEMVWHFLSRVPWVKEITLVQDINALQVRLTLDYIEDYWLISTIYRLVGGNASRKEVDDVFRRNPDFYKINWFRNQEWQDAQRVGFEK